MWINKSKIILKNFIRFLNTIKYLKFAQIFFRIWYLIYKPSQKKIKLPKVRRKSQELIFLEKKPSYNEKLKKFSFLNIESNHDSLLWNNQKMPRLWLYNLHYFDYINSEKVLIQAVRN